jgi:alkylhydroperoxidase family enzyme
MRIKGVDSDQAPAAVKEMYQRAEQMFGSVPTPFTVMAHVPDLLAAMNNLGAVIGGSTVVEPRLKTLASLRAAQIAGCPF